MKMEKNMRRGISELVGTVAMIAVTLIAAAAVWGWVNQVTSSSGEAYGTNVNANINYLREQETIPFAYFPSTQSLTVYIDNIGRTALAGYTVVVTGTSGQPSISCTQGGSGSSCCVISGSGCSQTISPNPLPEIAAGQTIPVTFTLQGSTTFFTGSNAYWYTIHFVGIFGSSSTLLVVT